MSFAVCIGPGAPARHVPALEHQLSECGPQDPGGLQGHELKTISWSHYRLLLLRVSAFAQVVPEQWWSGAGILVRPEAGGRQHTPPSDPRIPHCQALAVNPDDEIGNSIKINIP